MGCDAYASVVYGVPLKQGTDLGEEDTLDSPAALREVVRKGNPVVLVNHGWLYDRSYLVAIASTWKRGEWRALTRIKGVDSKPHPEWDAVLLDYVEKYRLTTEGKPGWYLAVSLRD